MRVYLRPDFDLLYALSQDQMTQSYVSPTIVLFMFYIHVMLPLY